MIEVIKAHYKRLISNITIEPVIIFFLFGYGILFTGLKNFELEKACATKTDYDLEVCGYFPQLEGTNACKDKNKSSVVPELVNYTMDQGEFSRVACSAKDEAGDALLVLNSYRNIITGVIQAVVLLFAGSWSDRAGLRKPCIVIPIAADIVSLIALIVCAIFMREIPLEITGILHQLISHLGGGGAMVLTGIYSYLTLVTTESERTFRFACTHVIMTIVPIIANFFSGFIFKALGFIKLCMLCTVTHSIALLYGLLVLKEPSKVDTVADSGVTPKEDTVQNEPPKVWKLFDLSLVTDCITVLTKKRNFNIRKLLILTLVVYFVNFGAAGDVSPSHIIAQVRFNWATNLGMWNAYDLLTTLLGTLLAIGVLGKRFGVSDHLICVFSVCFTLVAKPIMAYAATAGIGTLFYVATSIDVFDGSKVVAILSIVSKLVEQNEIAKINSIMGIISSIESMIYPTIYSLVYFSSKEVFIGAIFMLSEAFLLISLGFYVLLYIMSRKLNGKNNNQETEGVDNYAMEATAM